MSGLIMGQVWNLDLPQAEKLVLLAMADHADHEGNNVYPSTRLIAWKTDYSERHVRRTIKSLRNKDILVPQREDPGKVIIYRIDIKAAKQKQPLGVELIEFVTPDTGVTPDTAMSPPPLTPVSATPDTAMSPEPSLTVKETKDFVSGTQDVVSLPQQKPDKPKPDYDWKGIVKAVNESIGIYGAEQNHIANMLLGRSKKEPYSEYNLPEPATPDEITRFGLWMKRKHPDISIRKPGTIESYFLQYRAESKPKVTNVIQYIPPDPSIALTAWMPEPPEKAS